MRSLITMLFMALITVLAFAAVEGFTAHLARPWENTIPSRKRNAAFIRLYVSELEKISKAEQQQDEEEEAGDEAGSRQDQDENDSDDNDEESFSLADPEIPGSSSHVFGSGTSVAAATASTPSESVAPSSAVNVPSSSSQGTTWGHLQQQQQQHRQIEPMTSSVSASSPAGAYASSKPTVKSCLPDLFAMTRPSNMPGVVLFHMLGTHLATKSVTGGVSLPRLLASPSMIVTLLSLLLTSATSMLVNDYYDFKLGNDSAKAAYKPLNTQRVPLPVAKRFLSYLYAAALLCAAAVPGVQARISVVTGLMLTFWYTQHLKPRTWLKNTVCASLIALSPLTSGAAAIAMSNNASWLTNLTPLLRVTAMLFVGILGREMTMDINDVVDDKNHGVRTVPVVYGRKFASKIGLLCNLGVSGFALSGPLIEYILGNSSKVGTLRRLGMATVGSLALLRRSWQVYQSEGLDPAIVNRAVDEGLVTVVFLLASFL